MNGRRDALRSPGAAILVVVLALIAITGQLLGVASSGVHVYDPDRVDTSSILATATNTPADQDDLERRDSATEGAVGYDDGSQLARARPGEYRSAPNTGSISYGVLDDLGRPTGVTARLTPEIASRGVV